MGRKKRPLRYLVLGAFAALTLFFLPAGGLFAQDATLCAVVKLEIQQEATLEREGFDARLLVNNQTDQPLTDLKIQISMKDASGNPVDQGFFVKITSLTGTSSVSGTGAVQAQSSAEARWIIIPSSGMGGTTPLGQRYAVSAVITGNSAGVPQQVVTFDAFISVHPQPVLKLEYVLPYEVFADEPLTAALEPVEPFPLGVRVTNIGFGTARNFKIDSAQPKIVENKLGLAIDFKLLGTVVGGKTIPDTLLVPFGDIPPDGVGQASWIMATTLSGRFIEFTSTFTHAAELGGDLTSLIQSVTTYTLLRDVLVDLPGRDGTPDFLLNTSLSRESMQDILNAGGEPPAELLLESDQPAPIPVVEVLAGIEGTLGGANSRLTLTFSGAVGPNVWIRASVPFSYGTGIRLVSARRADGKVLNSKNVWISKHFRKSDKAVLYRLNLLDLTSVSNSYVFEFDPASVDQAPGAVGDLAAATGALGGELALSWTAPGEDGYAGAILGGRYLIQHEEDAGAAFNPNSAQINFTTSTAAGRMEAYAARGLVGNATHYLHLWTQDTGGGVSGLSNGATAYALPNPPRDLVFTAVGSNTAAVEWQVGNNRLPIEYQVRADTDAAAPFAAESPFFDSFSRSFVFAGLSPNTTYLFYGTARNTETLVTSELSTLGNTITLAAAPQARPAISISTGSLVVVWDASGNPGQTEYYAELSTAPSHDPVLAASGWTAQTSFSFAGLAAETTYYAQVKARNLALIETAFADLGAVRTAPGDSLPPRTSLVAGAPSFGAEPVFVSSLTLLGFSAVDDLTVAGDGAGFGVARTSYSVDGGSFAVFAASFSLAGEGLHEVRYFSVDVEGHEEGVVTSMVAVDNTAPATELSFSTTAFIDGTNEIFIASTTSVGFYAIDPSSFPAGIGTTEYRVDAATDAPFIVFGTTFTLVEGVHRFHFRSRDRVGNLEETKEAFVRVDATAPSTVLEISSPSYVAASSPTFVSPATALSLAAVDPEGAGAASGVRESFLSVEGSSFAVQGGTFSLNGVDGLKTLEFRSVDNVGNEEVRVTTRVFLDATVPVTELFVNGITASTGTITAISTDIFSIAAADLGAGVRRTMGSLDGSPYEPVPGSFSLSAGTHTVAFFSEDNLGNLEAPTTVFIEVRRPTAPVLTLTPVHGSTVTTAFPLITLAYVDEDFGIDTATVRLALDGVEVTTSAVITASSATFAPAFALSQGTHTVEGLAANGAGVESQARSDFFLDSIFPMTALEVGEPRFGEGPVFVASFTALGLSVSEPAQTYIAVDTTTFGVYGGSFTLAQEGAHELRFYSVDGAGNAEAVKTATVTTDRTAPGTELFVNGITAATGTVVARSSDVFSLAASDLGSGVRGTVASINGSPEEIAPSTFTLTAGTYTVVYRSEDNLGNGEEAKTAFLEISDAGDVTAPSVSLTPVHAGTVTTTAPLIVLVYGDGGSGVDLASVRFELDGVEVTTRAVVTASSASFTPGADLSQGTHTVLAGISDLSGNRAEARTTFLVDSLAPVTVLLINGIQTATGTVLATTTDYFSLSAADAGAGVQASYFSLDGAEPAAFAAPFTVAAGTHSLQFMSRDLAGNEEAVQTALLDVSSAPAAPAAPVLVPAGDGLALAAEAGGTLWMVVRSTEQVFRVLKLDAAGEAAGAVVLPGAVQDGRWSIVLSSSGEAYAAGTAGDSQSPPRTALYRVDPSGSVLLSSASFEPPAGMGAFAFDAAGELIIVGALQTGGTFTEAGPVGFTAALAVWRYDLQTNLVTLTTTYGGTGFDAGMGVRADGDGNLWVLGYSSNPATPGPNKLDLALWLFDPTGTQLMGGPARRPGYLRDIDDHLSGALVVSTAGVFAAAAKLNDSGNSDLAFLRFDLEGNLVFEKFWHGAARGDELPRALVREAGGELVIAGGSGGPNFAVWGYQPDGVLQGAMTVAGAGEVQDAAARTDGLWFAVKNSTKPLNFTGGTPLAGAEGLQPTESGATDQLPPRTAFSAGLPQYLGDRLYIASMTYLALSAVDDFASVGDGLGAGIAETRVSLDTGAFQAYAGSFTVALEGQHQLSWYSRDLAGNVETAKSTGVFVDATAPEVSVFINGQPAPEPPLQVTTTDIFTLSAADGGSGVEGIFRQVDEGPGGLYTGGFSLTAGTHTLSFAARDRVGNEGALQSGFVTVATAPAPLNPPKDLTVLARSGDALELAWDGNGNPEGTSYSVEWSTGDRSCGDLGETHGFFAVTSTTTLLLTGLAPATTFVIHVHTALPGGGVSAQESNHVIVATLEPGAGVQPVLPADYRNCTAPSVSTAPLSGIADPLHNATVASLLAISGTAADSDGIAEVAVSVQRLSDGFYWNGSVYQGSPVFVLASGTAAWVLNSPIGIHAGTGTFVISSLARDIAGTYEGAFRDGINRVTVTRRLNAPQNFRALSRADASLTLAWDLNGNPAGTRYAVHYASGACQANFIGAPFSPQTTGDQTVLSGLTPETPYTMHLHVYDGDGSDVTDFSGVGNYTINTLPAGQGPEASPVLAQCQGGPGGGGGGADSGLALGADAAGRLWEVIRESGVWKLARFNAQGQRETAGVTLTGATDQGEWSVAFDGLGNAYAAGGVGGAQGDLDLALFKADPNGNFVSSTVFNGSFNRNDFALDAVGDIWIGGAVQTDGPVDFSSPTVFQLALWRYCPHADSLTLRSTFSAGGGFDGAFGVALDDDRNVWVLGFSSNPANAGAAKLDLALWKFNPTGRNLLAGPFRRPAYIRDIGSSDFDAGLVYSSGSLYGAASRLGESGFMDQAFLKFDLGGNLLSERLWRAGPSDDAIPRSLAEAPNGDIVVSGQVGQFDSGKLAVWTYARDGALLSAQGSALSAGNDAVYLGQNLWLALQEQPAPYLFTGAPALGGTDILVSSSAADLTTPAIAIQSPAAGEVFRALSSTVAVRFTVTDALDPAPSFQAVLVQLEDRGTPRGVRPSTAPVVQGQDIPALDLDDGLWELRVSATDFALNSATASSGAFEVVHDVLPPRTSLAVGEPKFGTEPVYVGTGTGFGFVAVDDLLSAGDGAGLGVERTFYSVDGGSFAVFSASFTLASEGPRILRFFGVDRSSNTETVRTSTVTVDASAPVTSLLVNGIQASSGPLVLVSTDALSFAAADSGSGVRETRFAVDGGIEGISTASFTLAPGTHTITFHSEDNVLNLEALVAVSLTVLAEDAVAPVLSLSPVDGSTVTTARPVLAAVYSDAGRGIDPSTLRLFLDSVEVTTQAVITASSATFTPAADLAQGNHTLSATVADLAGNSSTASSRFFLDSLAPQTTLVVGEPKFGTEPIYAATFTAFGFQVNEPAQTFYAIDAGSFTVFAASFTIPAEGAHGVAFYSEDAFGNREAGKTAAVFTDATAPVTALLVNGQPAPSASFAAISTDVFSFSAVDAGAGVAEIRFSLDAGAGQVYQSTFSLSAGTRELAFFALDRLGKTEAAQTATVVVTGPDMQAPTLTFALSAGATVTSAAPTLAVSYFDAAGVDPASVRFFLDSVDVTSQAVVTASSASFTPSAGLSQGRHDAAISARDYNGNLSQASLIFYVDSVAPVTELLALGTYTVQAGLIVSQAGSSLTLTAQDPLVDGFATGVANTYYLVDAAPGSCPDGNISACPGSTFTSPFALQNGTHTVYYASRDRAGNLEAPKSTAAAADGMAPVISIQSPLAGQSFRALESTVAVRFGVTDNFDPVPAVQAALVQLEDRGTPRGARPAVVVVTHGQDLAPQSLDDGLWELRVSATDFVLNAGTAGSGAFEIVHDVLPPRTSLVVGEPKFGAYVGTGTALGFVAVDDLLSAEDGLGLGVERTLYSVDGGSFAVFSASFTLPSEGPRIFRFFGVDRSSNTETVRTSTVTVDASAPVTSLLVNGIQASTGPLVLVSTDIVSFAATDAGSGVRETRFAVDGGIEGISTASFTLAAGTHTITFHSEDKVLNLEALATVSLTVRAEDGVAPVLAVTPVDGSTVTTARPVLAAVYSDAGRGIDPATLRLFLDSVEVTTQAVVTASSATFTPAVDLTQGHHTLNASVSDLAGNLSTAFARFFIDSIAPVTTLAISGPRFGAAPLYVATATAFGLQVTEPAQTFYAVDAGSFTLFGGSFTLVLEGLRTISYYSVDAAGNQEVARSSQAFVDASAPVTNLLVNGIQASTGSLVIISTDALSFAAVDSASGVRETRFALDGGLESVSTGSFTLAAGTHTLTFRSEDQVANLESARSANLTVLAEDSVAPALSVFPVDGSTVTAARPAIVANYSDTGRGIDLTTLRLFLDSVEVTTQAVVTASSATFTPAADLAQGNHMLSATVADLAGNSSTASSRFFLDSLAPQTALLAGDPKFGTAPIYSATFTAFGFQVNEPAQTFYAIDAGTFTLFTASFTIVAEGTHAVDFYSEDPFGNREAEKTGQVFTDATAPITTLLVNGQPAPSASFAAISTDVFSFSATDAGAGVAEIRFSLDAGAGQVYQSTFSLSAGARELAFFALDRLGNAEAAQTATVAVTGPDMQAPTLTFDLSAGATVTSAAPTLAVSYFDAAGVDPASVRFFLDSVDVTSQAVVTASSASFTPSAALSQGLHAIEVSARDYNGNLAQASLIFYIDSIAPVTELLALGTHTVQAGLIVSQAGSSLTLTVQDPVVEGFATGVANTYYLVGAAPASCPGGEISGCPGSSFTTPFALGNGTHTVYYASRDRAGNLEAPKSAAAAADGAAPVIAIQSPPAGQSYRALESTVAVRFGVSDNFDPTPAFQAALVQLEDRGTPRGARPAVVAVGQGQDVPALDLDDGLWELRVSATDFVLNAGTAGSGVFEIVHDVLPPRTSLVVGEPKFGAGPVYVGTGTALGFAAVDDLLAVGDGTGLGTEQTYYSVDGSSFTATTTTFSLAAEGPRLVQFYSLDRSSNTETVRSSTVTVDAAAPVTSLLVNGVQASTGALVLVSTDTLSIASTDSGAGVRETRHALDGGPESVSTGSFTLAAGTHTLTFHSEDNVLNLEALVAVSLTVLAEDTVVPVLSVSPVDGSTVTTARPVLAAVFSDAGRGIDAASVRVFLDSLDVTAQAVVTASSATFTPAADLSQGEHTLNASVADLAGNLSTASARFFLDSVAPVTSLLVNGQAAAGGNLLAATTDSFGFSAADSGSGVAEIRYSLDAGAEQVFLSTFTLGAGSRSLRFFARDQAGNAEAARTVLIEVSAPETQGPTVAFELIAGSTLTGAMPVLAAAYADASGIDPASVRFFLDSVDVTSQAVVTASSASFTPSAALSQGRHDAAVSVRDGAGNLGSASLIFYIDSIAPVTELLALGTHTVQSGLIVSQAGSSLTLTAQDPVVDGFATGVADTFYLVDAAPASCPGGGISACPGASFTAPFALGSGTHTVYYASRDRAGNLEAPKSGAAAADGAAPVIAIQSPAAGQVYRALESTVAVRFSVTDNFDPAPAVQAVLVQLEDRGTPRGVRPAVVAVGHGQDLAPQSLDDGLWELRVSATDFVLNAAAASSGAFEIVHDVLPPRTSLVVGEPKFGAYVGTGTALGFVAVDDLLSVEDGLGLGVERTLYSVDGGSFAVFSASFTLASAGPRVLRFYSLDRSSNTESLQTSTVTVDATAPATSLLVNGIQASTGPLVLVSTDALSFAAADSGSGVRETRIGVDGGPEIVSAGSFTLAAGTHTLSYRSQDNLGNLETAKTAVISVVGPDLTAPVTFLEIGQPKFGTEAVFIATSTKLGLTASEAGRIYFAIDGGSFTVYGGSFTISGEGVRTVSWFGEDLNGNRETTKAATVFLDATAPVTELLVNGTSVAGGALNLTLGDVLGLSSTDTASGVREVGYSLDGGGFLVYGGTFTLGAGLHSLRFLGWDNVLNEEQQRNAEILVATPGGDRTPPSLSLLCPGAEGGICSVFRETVFVRGRIFDEQLRQFRLEAGTVLIASGTANIDGVLGVWDVSGLAGVQELTLTGEDLAGNVATLTRRVFIGEPVRLLIFGGQKEMGQPQGVAVDDARGIVYVANMNKGEIRLYTLGGEFIKKYPDFRHPRAVAVDEVGNLYIAESGKDRIVKLGPLGNLLWMKGESGRRPLEFRDPSGIAAKGGKVAVSDTRNRRVQILDENGNFQQEFPIPEGSETLVSDNGDEDDEPDNRKGVPVGIALDGQGRIYVADAKNKRGLAYDAQGILLREFGGPATFRRPEGIAVSTSGECVFVSDRIKDRIVKFDGEGRIVLAFGTQGNVSGKRTIPVETVFRRPIGLSLDAAGTLWAADRNNEVIQRFGLPGTLTAGSPTGGSFRVTDEDESREPASPAPNGAEEFYLRQAYPIPNPCRSCSAQGFVAQLGLADSVTLECRNIMGRVVFRNDFGAPRLTDTGNGRGVQYTYEQQWPLSGVGTGLYTCVITGRKAGKAEIRKLIRTAIIR